MSTAMITACFTGLVRAIGMLSTVIVLAESINFLLFSVGSEEATGNNVCNPYHFKNSSKLTAKALGFIFFAYPRKENFYSTIYPGNYHSSTLQRNDVTQELFANRTMQNPTTCL
jgi:hypothetical protein